jgi:hypothetical protein
MTNGRKVTLLLWKWKNVAVDIKHHDTSELIRLDSVMQLDFK